MYDLAAIQARLEDSRSGLRVLEGELVRHIYQKLNNLEGTDSLPLALWRRELEFLYGDIDALLEPDSGPLWERYGLPPGSPSRLFQSVQTCYSVLVKLIAFRLAGGEGELPDILSGRAFREAGVCNYCYEDWFSWILADWDGETEKLCTALRDQLEDTAVPPGEVPAFRPDSFRQLYESAVPQRLRRALGEFHTPGWLIRCVLDNALAAADRPAEELSFLDPTCGSGGFLVCAMELIQARTGGRVGPEQVWGMDINPLAVLTAKTAYLAARAGERVRVIPVYQGDVIHLPQQQGDRLVIDAGCGLTCVLPLALCRRVRDSKKSPFQPEKLLSLVREGAEGCPHCAQLWKTLSGLDSFSQKILANRLLNQIFLFFHPRADAAVGNPPWVNWENLPEDCRARSRDLWPEYGLLDTRGWSMSFSKEDISTLITCVVIHRLVRERGLVSFVLRQVLFKSAQNGAMFRRFQVKEIPFRVLRVDDLSETNPFPGLGTRSALVLIRRDEAQRFPVDYCRWRRRRGFWKVSKTPSAPADRVLALVERQELAAFPAVRTEPSSPWVSAPAELARELGSLLGQNPYRARTGVFTGGANGVFWLDRLEPLPGGTVLADNGAERARRKVRQVRAELETRYLYPLLQGSGLEQWRVSGSRYILCPHDRDSRIRPVEEEALARDVPGTWAYLQSFRAELEGRGGVAGWERNLHGQHFYTLLRVGAYTFAPYKVAWRYIARSFITAVVSTVRDPVLGEKLYLPNEKVVYVGLEDEGEAYYLCGVLSSAPIRFCVQCYMSPISISAHVLDKLNIPPYCAENPLHREIGDLCRMGHRTQDPKNLQTLQSRLDRAAGVLYGMGEGTVERMRTQVTGGRRTYI